MKKCYYLIFSLGFLVEILSIFMRSLQKLCNSFSLERVKAFNLIDFQCTSDILLISIQVRQGRLDLGKSGPKNCDFLSEKNNFLFMNRK